MKKPILVIMAAGIGSRFGGLKQMAPVGKNNEPIIEFSIFDAIEAGFEKVVFIIKKEIEDDFRKLIGDKVKNFVDVEYAFQEISMIPEGYHVPEGRIKPWGTGHAVMCAKEYLDQPFAVINADDYYGKDAFRVMCDFLKSEEDDSLYRLSMVGYKIENTLTDSGHVTRGVCTISDGFMESIVECHRIEKHGNDIEYTVDGGSTWNAIKKGTTVSMNLWGFPESILKEMDKGFPLFLDRAYNEDPIKAEYLLPTIINNLVQEGRAAVKVLSSSDKWYGITYKEDLEPVASSIQELQDKGLYPLRLFG